MIPTTQTRLEQFERQIATENVNFDVVGALSSVNPLAPRVVPKAATVALVAGAEMMSELEDVASVVPLRRDAWKRQIEAQPIDLVVVETDYACLDGWRTDLLAGSSPNELVTLANACHAKDLPCALWVTLGRCQTALLEHLFDAFAFVFVADSEAYAALAERLGGKVRRVPPSVDVRRFNPALRVPAEHTVLHGAMPVVSDCLSSIMYHDPDGELLAFLQKAMAYKTWLYESRDLVRPRESYIPAHMLRRSLGTLTHDAAASIPKLSDVSIILENPNRRSYWVHQRRVLRAMASKSLPVSNAIDPIAFADLGPAIETYLRADAPEIMAEKVEALMSKRLLRERLQHLAFRETVGAHALDARLADMLAIVGRPPAAPWSPKVSPPASRRSSICPTTSRTSSCAPATS